MLGYSARRWGAKENGETALFDVIVASLNPSAYAHDDGQSSPEQYSCSGVLRLLSGTLRTAMRSLIELQSTITLRDSDWVVTDSLPVGSDRRHPTSRQVL